MLVPFVRGVPCTEVGGDDEPSEDGEETVGEDIDGSCMMGGDEWRPIIFSGEFVVRAWENSVPSRRAFAQSVAAEPPGPL